MMTSVAGKIPKLLRRLAGQGCRAADFDPVYARAEQDAWRYTENPFERTRFARIIDVLDGLVIDNALEVGCAEGHLTRLLAGCVQRLLACDIVDTALARARRHCADLENVRFLNIDVRSRWPDETFDLLIYSDVLYYFSKPEVRRVLRASAEHIRIGGHLLFANEWHDHYRWKTPPTYIMDQLGGSPLWQPVFRRHDKGIGTDRSLTLGLFQRRSLS